MKTSTILLIILCSCNSFLFGQVKNDSLGGNVVYPIFYDSFSAEESWEIHKEAYIKQLRAKGLAEDEIESKVAAYLKNKAQFIENILEQRRLAAIQRKKADAQRKIADKQRELADIQRKKADEQREIANKNRELAALQRKKADAQRIIADKQRGQASIEREKAAKQREMADKNRELAALQREKADKQREMADKNRELAAVQREKAEEWRNRFENIVQENFTISNQSSNSNPIIFKINKRTTLLFNIRGELSSGNVLIEIINPKGKKVGELSLEHKKGASLTNQEDYFKTTSGYLNKTISDSEIGDWQIEITAQKSEGTLSVSVSQYNKPTVNE